MASTTGQREDKNHERQEEHEKGASSIALGKVPSCRGDEQAVEPDRRATLDSQSISCPLRLSRARCREPVPLRDRDLRPWNAGYKRRSCLTHERPVRPFVLLILFERGLSRACRTRRLGQVRQRLSESLMHHVTRYLPLGPPLRYRRVPCGESVRSETRSVDQRSRLRPAYVASGSGGTGIGSPLPGVGTICSPLMLGCPGSTTSEVCHPFSYGVPRIMPESTPQPQ